MDVCKIDHRKIRNRWGSSNPRDTSNRRSRTRIAKSLVAVAVNPFPVPLSLAGNISGEIAYKTPYIIWTTK